MNLEGEISRLTYSWPPATTAWLVIAGGSPSENLRRWAGQFDAVSYPTAQGARLFRLDPLRRDGALAGW